jgi:2,3-bisphosphoglycerate-independent phosphoglycerate mutase
MKVIVVQLDGLGDEPVADLGGKTPLEVARTPHLDGMASKGILGLARTVPPGVAPGGEVGPLAILGYDPARVRTSCAALDAAGEGVALGPTDLVFRLSLVVTGLAEDGTEILRDAQPGALDPSERTAVLRAIAEALADDPGVVVHAGRDGRGLLVLRGGADVPVRTLPPHAVLGKPLAVALPIGPGAERVRALMRRGAEVVARHPVCEAHRTGGDVTPSAVWLSGLDVLAPTPPNGDGPLPAVVGSTLAALVDHDLVLVHLPDADEAGHRGDAAGKVQVIERLDAELVGPLLEALAGREDDWRVLVAVGHATPCGLRTHTADPVPFVVYVARDKEKARGQKRGFDERDARELGIFIPEAHGLLERLLRE